MRTKLYTRKKKMKGGHSADAYADARAAAAAATTTVPTDINNLKNVDASATAETKETSEAEEEEAKAAAEQAQRESAKEELIATLNKEIEEIEKELERLSPNITKIYNKSQQIEDLKNNENSTGEELSPKEFADFKEYIDVYKSLVEKQNELYKAENSTTEEWSFTSLFLAPVKKFFGSLLGNIKKMGAKATTASVKGMTGFVVECYKEIQPNLIEFAKLKGETQRALVEATRMPPVPDVSAVTPDVSAVTPDVSGAVAPDVSGVAPVAPVGGGRPNLKEVQRGGAAAAKRVENSIKQFLGSSVTTSHILNMVKRKTKVKRKRDSKGIRQSRKRAKNQ
jgi:hypothetical protein